MEIKNEIELRKLFYLFKILFLIIVLIWKCEVLF